MGRTANRGLCPPPRPARRAALPSGMHFGGAQTGGQRSPGDLDGQSIPSRGPPPQLPKDRNRHSRPSKGQPLGDPDAMGYTGRVGKGLQLSSGRIVALGRLMLASLYLLASWFDVGPAPRAAQSVYAILAIYILFAIAIVVLTWANWWRDARLAGPAHAVDIVMFTALVLLTEGYASPFFAFFMFVLLAAAFRWDWHATALTATLLTLLYLVAGLIVKNSGIGLEDQRFLVRTGHLVILSLIVIWFGANQRWALFDLGKRERLAE